MNTANLLIICASLIIWSQIVQMIVPTWTGRALIGISGSLIIGAAWAINGITAFNAIGA